MKIVASVGATLVLAGTAVATPVDCFAFDTFDSAMRLLSFSQNPLPGAFSSPGDGFEVYQRGVSASIPFALLDDTNAGFPGDTLGIVNSTKLDRWFGVNDLTNNDNASGQASATWVFDISGYQDLSISIDMAAMGDYEATAGNFDFYNWSYSIDGGVAQAIFTSTVREDLSQTYTLESGAMFTLDDPLEMNGTLLSNVFQTLSAAVNGTGSQLTLMFNAQNDSDEPYVFDNITICGTLIPTPGATALFGLASLAGLRRRR